jgi:hypothetical protein
VCSNRLSTVICNLLYNISAVCYSLNFWFLSDVTWSLLPDQYFHVFPVEAGWVLCYNLHSTDAQAGGILLQTVSCLTKYWTLLISFEVKSFHVTTYIQTPQNLYWDHHRHHSNNLLWKTYKGCMNANTRKLATKKLLVSYSRADSLLFQCNHYLSQE